MQEMERRKIFHRPVKTLWANAISPVEHLSSVWDVRRKENGSLSGNAHGVLRGRCIINGLDDQIHSCLGTSDAQTSKSDNSLSSSNS